MAGKHILRAGALLLCLTQFPAQAVNLRWLDNSPVHYFSDRDWELAMAASDDALANPTDGNTVEWRNPETGHSGSSTARGTLQREGKTCRELAMENRAKGKADQSAFLFCLQPDGEWKIEQSMGGSPGGQ